MPGRIEGFGDCLAAGAAAVPLWRAKWNQLAEKVGLKEPAPKDMKAEDTTFSKPKLDHEKGPKLKS